MKQSNHCFVQSVSSTPQRIRGGACKDRISSIAGRCARAAVPLRAASLALLLGAAWPVAAQTAAPSRTIQTFTAYYGGGPGLVASDAAKLAKYDLIDIDRFRYNQLAPNTWSAIRAFNPKVEIYLYEMGPESQNYMDATPAVSINGLGRHNVSRGHSMGTLNGNHPELFILDASGNIRFESTEFDGTKLAIVVCASPNHNVWYKSPLFPESTKCCSPSSKAQIAPIAPESRNGDAHVCS